VASALRSSSALWGRYRPVSERDISRKVDWTSSANFRASSVARCNSDRFLPVVHLKMHVYTFPTKTIKDLMVRLQAALITVDTNMLERVRENDVWRSAAFLSMRQSWPDRLEAGAVWR
jgi:hypothetical protein